MCFDERVKKEKILLTYLNILLNCLEVQGCADLFSFRYSELGTSGSPGTYRARRNLLIVKTRLVRCTQWDEEFYVWTRTHPCTRVASGYCTPERCILTSGPHLFAFLSIRLCSLMVRIFAISVFHLQTRQTALLSAHTVCDTTITIQLISLFLYTICSCVNLIWEIVINNTYVVTRRLNNKKTRKFAANALPWRFLFFFHSFFRLILLRLAAGPKNSSQRVGLSTERNPFASRYVGRPCIQHE